LKYRKAVAFTICSIIARAYTSLRQTVFSSELSINHGSEFGILLHTTV